MMQEVLETGDEKTGGNSHRNKHEEEEGQTPQTTQPGLEDTVLSECFDF